VLAGPVRHDRLNAARAAVAELEIEEIPPFDDALAREVDRLAARSDLSP
jgi:hypothetical protein